MENMLLSVIVPVYNGQNYISRCVNSIINQTYKNIEIIIVNDGSNDNTCEICSTLQQKDSRIKLINIENSGVSEARNKGLEIAKRRIYYFC